MKLILGLLFILNSTLAFSQTREEMIEQFMRERKEMMKQMMKMFRDDFSGMDNFFEDDFDPFDSMKSFKGGGTNVEIEEKYEDDGSISIIITPKSENISLDIKTDNGMITIKSDMKTKIEENGSTSFSSSSYSRSIAIPQGYSAKAPVAAGKGLKISLVPNGKVKKIMDSNKKRPKPSKDLKVPIGKQPGEDMI